MKVTVGPTNNLVFQPSTDRGTSAKITLSSGGGGGGGAGGLEAYGQANAARLQANTARTTANDAYDQANTARLTANNAYDTANLKLNIAGGTLTGSLNISGNLSVTGNTKYINVETYIVTDPLIYLASNNETSDLVDIGFMGGKNTAGVYNHTGLARDATDATWYLFDGLADEGHINNVVDFANTTLATLRANILANNIELVGNTVATQANLILAYDQANAARNQANTAYGDSNTRVLKSGDTMTGTLNVNFNGVGLNVNSQAEFGRSVLIGNSNTGIYLLDDVNGFASIELGGAVGGYIDFKMPVDDDYDFRIYSQDGQTQFISADANQKVKFIGANVSFDTDTLAVDVVNRRVGVGTNTPDANLTVVGTANVTNTISTNTVNFGFGVYDLTSNTFQTTSNDLIEVDSFAAASYSTVKYIVQVKTGVSLHSTELFCIQDGVSTYLTEYATLISGAPLGSFSINLVGGRMKLNFNPDNPLNNILTFKVVRYTISS